MTSDDCRCIDMPGGHVARCLRCFLLCCEGDPQWTPRPPIYVQHEVREAARRILAVRLREKGRERPEDILAQQAEKRRRHTRW